MVQKLNRQEVAKVAVIHAVPPAMRAPTRVDRSFELPRGLYVATVAFYLGFIAVMGLGFANPEMILPVAIFALFVVAGFGVPSIWARMRPDSGQRAMSWARFRHRGISTNTGHCAAGPAMVQVLILPALIFLWGIVTVTIAAVVG